MPEPSPPTRPALPRLLSRPPPLAGSRTEELPGRHHPPIEMTSPRLLFPLAHSKSTGINTRLLPASLPPLHRLLALWNAPHLHLSTPCSPLLSFPPIRAPSCSTPIDATKLHSPPSPVRLTAPQSEVSRPLGSPHRPLASRASAASHLAPERLLGRAPAAGHCEVHGGPMDRPLHHIVDYPLIATLFYLFCSPCSFPAYWSSSRGWTAGELPRHQHWRPRATVSGIWRQVSLTHVVPISCIYL
jgi:hypothetical protein